MSTGVLMVVVGLLTTLAGVGLALYAQSKYRSPSAATWPSLNPAHWTPIWRQRERFAEARGYRLYVAGVVAWTLGLAVLFVYFAMQVFSSPA